MYCPNCGKENQEGARFCGGCGFALQEQNPVENQPQRIRPEDGTRGKQINEPSTGGGKPKKHRGLIRVIIVLAVVLIALLAAAAAALYFTKFSPQARWQEQYDLGEQYLLEMDYEQAIVAFTAAIEIDPEETAAYLGRAEAYIGEDIEEASDESLQAALDDYDTVLELEPERTEAYLGEADIYVVMDDYDSARDILEDGLEHNPDDEELLERLDEIEEQIEERNLFNRYQAYYEKLMELQELYGKAGLYFDSNADLYYRSGLFFAKLIDFDGDGAEELVTAVFDADILEETGYYSNSYLIQVWSCADEDDEVQEVYQQGHYKLYLGAGCYIACSDAVSYMVDGYDEYWSGDVPNESFYTYADGAFYAAKMFGSDGSDLTDTLTVDGEAVSDEEWNEAYDEWYADITAELKYYFWWYNGFEVTEYETASAPDELADTLDTLRSLLGIEEEEAGEEWLELDSLLDDFEAFYDAVGGSYSDETGDFENWILADGIEYGNYANSSAVDELTVDSEEYALFGIYVGLYWEDVEDQMAGWELTDSAGDTSSGYFWYASDNQNLIINIFDECVSDFTFWRDMDDYYEDETDWASIYLEILDNITVYDGDSIYEELYGYDSNYGEYYGFSLIYVNDDDIPELVIHGAFEAACNIIFTIDEDGNVDMMMTHRLYFYYAERGNILVNDEGNMGAYSTVIYGIEDGVWIELAGGTYEVVGDDDMVYYWEGEEVSEEQYQANISAYTNGYALIDGDEAEYTLASLKNYLSQ